MIAGDAVIQDSDICSENLEQIVDQRCFCGHYRIFDVIIDISF